MEATTDGSRQRYHARRMLVARAAEVRGGGENGSGDGSRGRGFIGQLFAVEKQAKMASRGRRLASRQTQSVPLCWRIATQLLTGKNSCCEASHGGSGELHAHPMEELTVFTSDGRGAIDNM